MRGLGHHDRSRHAVDGRGLAGHWWCALTLALAITACGQQEQPGLGAGVAVPTTVATTTTTIVTTTSSTVDFARPILQGTAPLVAEAGPTDVAALVADVRGQTADVVVQVERLAPFLDLRITPVAQISDLDVTLGTEQDDRHPVLATVRFRVPNDGREVVDAIADSFLALAWNLQTTETTESSGLTTTEMVFRVPWLGADEAEFRSIVTSGDGPTTVEWTYLALAESDDATDAEETTYFERLSAWQDGLDLTTVADLTEVAVETTEDAGLVVARYQIVAEDEAEALARLARAAAGGDYELLGGSADEPPTTGPLRLVDEAGTIVTVEVGLSTIEGTLGVEASHQFDLTPLD